MVTLKLRQVMRKGSFYSCRAIAENEVHARTYERRFTIEVLDIDHESLGFTIHSVDYVPSGYAESGTRKALGSHVVMYEDTPDVNETAFQVWRTIVKKVDPDYVKFITKGIE